MSKTTSKSVNIFLALEKKVIDGYFNPHDTSPIYKRQLSLKFENYISQSIKNCKRHDPIFFKLNSHNKMDEQYADPVMYAIRGHFKEKLVGELKAFKRFKQRNYGTLGVSLVVVSVLNLLLPVVMTKETADQTGTAHFLDVFGFIIFYHPLTELLFNWNPFLKRINLLNKLISAEAIIVSGDRSGLEAVDHSFEEYESLEDPGFSF
ncbi:MAG TPA: hypothetical protein VF602_10765 [Pedobacter sp.]|jgi:hypothetical protein